MTKELENNLQSNVLDSNYDQYYLFLERLKECVRVYQKGLLQFIITDDCLYINDDVQLYYRGKPPFCINKNQYPEAYDCILRFLMDIKFSMEVEDVIPAYYMEMQRLEYFLEESKIKKLENK